MKLLCRCCIPGHAPRYPDLIYPLNYGYLKGISGGDGHDIDVWQGSLENAGLVAIVCTIDALKCDSEVKLLVNCTPAEIEIVNRFHNDSDSMSGIVVLRDRRS